MKFFLIIMVIYMAVFFGWFWSVAIGLQSRIPANVKMKIKKFKIFFFIPFIYILLVILFIGFTAGAIITRGGQPDTKVFAGLFAIIVPLHLFSMFCMFYILYFVAKTIKTAELQRDVKFGDFAAEFFLIWFYPIGIWIVQPKINKLVEGSTFNNADIIDSGYLKN